MVREESKESSEGGAAFLVWAGACSCCDASSPLHEATSFSAAAREPA
jgi:hypothetical protein